MTSSDISSVLWCSEFYPVYVVFILLGWALDGNREQENSVIPMKMYWCFTFTTDNIRVLIVVANNDNRQNLSAEYGSSHWQ